MTQANAAQRVLTGAPNWTGGGTGRTASTLPTPLVRGWVLRFAVQQTLLGCYTYTCSQYGPTVQANVVPVSSSVVQTTDNVPSEKHTRLLGMQTDMFLAQQSLTFHHWYAWCGLCWALLIVFSSSLEDIKHKSTNNTEASIPGPCWLHFKFTL